MAGRCDLSATICSLPYGVIAGSAPEYFAPCGTTKIVFIFNLMENVKSQ